MNMMLPVALHAASGFFRIVQRTLGALNCIPFRNTYCWARDEAQDIGP